VPSSKTAAREFCHGLRENPADARKTIGTGERNLIRMQLDPAMIDERFEYPDRLFPVIAYRRRLVVLGIL
jgi:hypothetical protein